MVLTGLAPAARAFAADACGTLKSPGCHMAKAPVQRPCCGSGCSCSVETRSEESSVLPASIPSFVDASSDFRPASAPVYGANHITRFFADVSPPAAPPLYRLYSAYLI